MRIGRFASLLLTLGATSVMQAGEPAQAQKYRVSCVAPGTPSCRVSCGSNTRTVVCYASVRNGRCIKYCGPRR